MSEQDLVYSCGRLELDLSRRELRSLGVPVPIGNRAFEILEVLVRSAGEIVTKDEIIHRVWPGGVVEENTIEVHVSAVRKALGPDRGMLKTAYTRGYRLLGHWYPRARAAPPRGLLHGARPDETRRPRNNLPHPVSALIGRAADLDTLRGCLTSYRAVTLTGPGGIGKTTLALALARGLLPGLPGDCWFVELAPLTSVDLVAPAIAMGLGLDLGGRDGSPASIARAIGDRPLLLVLDNCEHVLGGAAAAVEALVRYCPGVTVLSTSREPLRVEGEFVWPVLALDVPSAGDATADDLIKHGAVQLFIARMYAQAPRNDLWDEEIAAAGAICRRLEGIPLAIEFAAARAATLGAVHVLARLNDPLRLLTTGRRTVLPRHQTLRAALDWSYELLGPTEQRLLEALSIFSSGFGLVAAAAVADPADEAVPFEENFSNLVAKSLVGPDSSGRPGRYRLLETTRAYAFEKLRKNGQWAECARRHAKYLRDLLLPTGQRISAMAGRGIADAPTRELDDVRAALRWTYSEDGDRELGVAITAGYTEVWLQLSLVSECADEVRRALAVLTELDLPTERRAAYELRLRSALAATNIMRHGLGPEADAAWAGVLDLVGRTGDADAQLDAVRGLWLGHLNLGDFRHAFRLAEDFLSRVGEGSDPFDPLSADRMVGYSLHFLGDQAGAKRALERMLSRFDARLHSAHIARYGFDQVVSARMRLAWTLWLHGLPDRAAWLVEQAAAEALAGGHALTLVTSLAQGACSVALARGDVNDAARYIQLLKAQSTLHGISTGKAIAGCYEAILSLKGEKNGRGIAELREVLADPAIARLALWFTSFRCELAAAYELAGDVAAGLAEVDAALERIERLGEGWCLPEALRLRGVLLQRRAGQGDADEAEALFRRAMAVAQEGSAQSWELRAATSLAKLLAARKRRKTARDLLAHVYGRFTEGFSTADLRAAAALLAELA